MINLKSYPKNYEEAMNEYCSLIKSYLSITILQEPINLDLSKRG